MSSHTERQPRWQITHNPSGHHYFLYEMPPITEAREIWERLKKNATLIDDMHRTPSPEEKEQIRALIVPNAKKFIAAGQDIIFKRCLRLSEKEIGEMPQQEFFDILVRVLKITLEEKI